MNILKIKDLGTGGGSGDLGRIFRFQGWSIFWTLTPIPAEEGVSRLIALLVGVRDPRTGYFGPWVRVVDWAWTPEETSSRPRRRRRRRRHQGGGIPKTKSFVFRRMWTISGRRLRHFDRTDLARLFLPKKLMVFRHFPALGGSGTPRGSGIKIQKSKIQKSKNPKIQNPKIYFFF